MNLFDSTKERMVRYAKINTRSDASAPMDKIPTTDIQLDLLDMLVDELKEIGMEDVEFNPDNAYVTATLPANTEHAVPVLGFIAHVDTADFNSVNVNPLIWPDYEGGDLVLNEEEGIVLKVEDFPALNNYHGQTLITTDGTTLLGADDKAGISAIMSAMEYLINHPEIKHGKIRVGFGPDEEIGRGALHFDVDHFGADYAYTLDGGHVGEMQYETFNAAQAKITVTGRNVHPGTAKGQMINALTVLMDFMNLFPQAETPENTDGRQGFYHWSEASGTVDQANMTMIIRDHDNEKFQSRKEYVQKQAQIINEKYPSKPLELEITDQYYNMVEVIKDYPECIDLAKSAMQEIGIAPNVVAFRGGTDGSIISFKGLPTPNLFMGAENMHSRYEFVAVESMVKASQLVIKMAEMTASGKLSKK